MPRLLAFLALALLLCALLLVGCTSSQRSRTTSDPYSMQGSSDPDIRAGNPY